MHAGYVRRKGGFPNNCLTPPYHNGHLPTDHSPSPKRSSASPLRLFHWNKGKEDTVKDINHKMQQALEEALMKSIHLQEVSFRRKERGGGQLACVVALNPGPCPLMFGDLGTRVVHDELWLHLTMKIQVVM